MPFTRFNVRRLPPPPRFTPSILQPFNASTLYLSTPNQQPSTRPVVCYPTVCILAPPPPCQRNVALLLASLPLSARRTSDPPVRLRPPVRLGPEKSSAT